MWTPERLADALRMHSSGMSGSQIAMALGGVTRNAVIGKLHRQHKHMSDMKLPDVVRLHVVAPRRSAACQWPIGNPDEPDFHFCGAARERGSYCAHHAAIAYEPAKPRRAA